MDASLLGQISSFKQTAVKNVGLASGTGSSYSTYTSDNSRKRKANPKPDGKTEKLTKDAALVSSSSKAPDNAMLAKIIDYLKKRHLNPMNPLTWGLSVDEILAEINIGSINSRSKAYLFDSLQNNIKIQETEPGKFQFKPIYKIKTPVQLKTQLEKLMREGKPGISGQELAECTPFGDKFLKEIEEDVIKIPTQINKRKDFVYFYNSHDYNYELDDEYRGLWRSVNVSQLDEKKIEEYLTKHGIESIQDVKPKMTNTGVPKRKQNRKRANAKVHNLHLASVLEDYAE
uniref:Transcription initiation factor IIE subunit beta n=1 Tax=Rhabditophanes sp. KR3021 TaxID=114890 RepID=A0AC35TI61_9BILA